MIHVWINENYYNIFLKLFGIEQKNYLLILEKKFFIVKWKQELFWAERKEINSSQLAADHRAL